MVIAAPGGSLLTPSSRGSPGRSGTEEASHSGNLPSQGKEEKGDSETLGTCGALGSADASLSSSQARGRMFLLVEVILSPR